MTDFFVDHLKKIVHRRQYAGDACGFLQTPVEKREFTDSPAYVRQLEEQEMYARCPHCESMKMFVK